MWWAFLYGLPQLRSCLSIPFISLFVARIAVFDIDRPNAERLAGDVGGTANVKLAVVMTFRGSHYTKAYFQSIL